MKIGERAGSIVALFYRRRGKVWEIREMAEKEREKSEEKSGIEIFMRRVRFLRCENRLSLMGWSNIGLILFSLKLGLI